MKEKIFRYWAAYLLCLTAVLTWYPCMYFMAGTVGKYEMFYELTYLIFHPVFVPLIFALSIVAPSLFEKSERAREPKNKRLPYFRRAFWIGATILLLVSVFGAWYGSMVSPIRPYELADETNQSDAFLVEQEARKIWRSDESRRQQKQASLPADENDHAQNMKDYKKFTSKEDAHGIPRSTNIMRTLNGVLTAFVASILLVFVFWRILCKQIFNRGTRYPNPGIDIVIVSLCLPWVYMRLFADWHASHWEVLRAPVAPLTLPVILLMFLLIGFLGIMTFIERENLHEVLEATTPIQKLAASLMVILNLLGMGTLLIGAESRIGMLLAMEDALSTPANQIGLVTAVLISTAFAAYCGHSLVKIRIR